MKYSKRTLHTVLTAAMLTFTAAAAYGAGELPAGATVVVAPMTKAMFNQGSHFNRMCPLGDNKSPDNRCYAGCTAVAESIVLDYYQWPYASVNGCRPYDWEAIGDTYGNVESARRISAVAELNSDAGLSLQVSYGTSSTSADFLNVARSLRNDFAFTDLSSGELDLRNGITATHHQLIQNQLAAGHPVLCSGAAGAGAGAGHTYVCDGYAVQANSTPLYHFNFGWAGRGNSWWPLDGVVTQAVASDTDSATPHPVLRALVNVLPQREPQIHTVPPVTSSNLELAWSLPNCWNNELTAITVERQTQVATTVNQELTAADWAIDSAGGFGWAINADKLVGSAYNFWGSTTWPGSGSSREYTVTPLSISRGNTLTLKYSARKFDSGVKLLLKKAVWDAQFNCYTDFTSSGIQCPTVVTLTGGDSTASMKEITRVISGSELAAAFGEIENDAHFVFVFENSSFSCSYAAGTELFRLESMTLSGEGLEWQTAETKNQARDSRSAMFNDVAAGNNRFVVTAHYGANAYSAAVETKVATVINEPTITLASESNSAVQFNVTCANAYTYGFTKQNNDAMNGTAAKSGNTITYTYNNYSNIGTHWLALTVTNSVTGAVGRYVHVTNPPTDHALVADTEFSYAAAVARALQERKPIFLFSTGEIDNVKFKTTRTVLADSAVVNAVRDRYVFVEARASVPEVKAFVQSLWKQQSGGMGFEPSIYGYGFIIDPREPDKPLDCTASFNSQLELTSMLYGVPTSIANFLNQNFEMQWDEPEAPKHSIRILIK